jgi:hypothetical protein
VRLRYILLGLHIAMQAELPNRKDHTMGELVAEGTAPYDVLDAISSRSEPTPDGVLVVVTATIEHADDDYQYSPVPVRLLLTPEDALALANQMQAVAPVARRWMDRR